MEVIRDFCLKNNCPDKLIVTEFDKFKVYSKKDHSIRQQAEKYWGMIVGLYRFKQRRKKRFFREIADDILEKLTATIQEKTIIKKTLVDE
jgi:hypothetical protein